MNQTEPNRVLSLFQAGMVGGGCVKEEHLGNYCNFPSGFTKEVTQPTLAAGQTVLMDTPINLGVSLRMKSQLFGKQNEWVGEDC